MRAAACAVFLIISGWLSAQRTGEPFEAEADYFRTNIILHSPDLTALIKGHPDGVFLSLSRKTIGKHEWEALYNYPDYGAYFLYQDFKNPILGQNYALGVDYNFYFLRRHLTLKVAGGLALATNPYDHVTNTKNVAFGSKLMANVDFLINYKKENLFHGFGIQTGFIFTHFSGGRTKSPNSGINTYGLNLGVNYNFDDEPHLADTTRVSMKMSEPLRYSVVFRSGVNESPVIGSGQKPFYHIQAFADKRLNRKSALQLGAELFLTTSIKEYIKFRSIAFPEEHVAAGTDYKRVGIFIGHELFINRLSVETQVGYYIYRPFDVDMAIYDRVGVKYYLTDKIFAALAVKTHGFLAEAMEYGVGVRL